MVKNYGPFMNQLAQIPFVGLSFSQFGESVILKSNIDEHCPELLDYSSRNGCFVDLGAFIPLPASMCLHSIFWVGAG